MKILLLFSVFGFIAGFISGLLGVGGGIVMMPLFLFAFPFIGLKKSVYVYCAVGTSSAAAFFFTLSGCIAYLRSRLVNYKIIPFLGIGGILGAVSGAFFATLVDAEIFKKIFAIFLIFSALRIYGIGIGSANLSDKLSGKKPFFYFIVGLLSGFVGAFFGVGGGIVAVPAMIFSGLDVKNAIATSSALIPWITLFSSLSYMYYGWGHPDLPYMSLGFIYIIALLGVVPTGIIGAQIGAFFSLKANKAILKRLFACLLIIVAVKILISK